MQTVIYTYRGARFNLFDPDPDLLDPEDLAHALANCNRFAGHARVPLSVAQHCVWAGWLTADATEPWVPLQALLHDAAEAYLGDVTKWLKAHPTMDAYRRVEERLQRLVYHTFGLPEETHPAVEAADRLLVRWEMGQLFPAGCTVGAANPAREADYPPLTAAETAPLHKWEPWDWREAKRRWLAELRRLTTGRAFIPSLTKGREACT